MRHERKLNLALIQGSYICIEGDAILHKSDQIGIVIKNESGAALIRAGQLFVNLALDLESRPVVDK